MFKDELRTALQESGNTYIELSEKLDISSKTVSDWLQGKKIPDQDYRPIVILNAKASTFKQKSKTSFSCDLDNWRVKNNISFKYISTFVGVTDCSARQWVNGTNSPRGLKYEKLMEMMHGRYITVIDMLKELNEHYGTKGLQNKLQVREDTLTGWMLGTVRPRYPHSIGSLYWAVIGK